MGGGDGVGVGEVEREMVKVASPVMGLEFSLPSLARREPSLGHHCGRRCRSAEIWAPERSGGKAERR